MDLILYHASCPDGWVAAYICKKKYPNAELLPLNHGLNDAQLSDVVEACTGKDVIMVDYSLRTRLMNDNLAAICNSFRILDHHKSAREVLDGAPYATFDMLRSGAGLAWDYLFGKDSGETCEVCDHNMPDGRHSGHRPWWVDYAEDQDLWNWKLPLSDRINAFLMVQSRTIESWDVLTAEYNAADAAKAGRGVRQYIEYYTRSVVAEKQEGVFVFEGRNYRTALLNIPYAGVSEAGNALVNEGYEIGAAWFERGDGIIQFSLRSRKGSDVDVSKIAASFGGGGHQSAAGFQIKIDEGRALVDAILGRREVSFDTLAGRCVK